MTLNPVDFERRVRSVENRASKLWNEIQQTWKRLDQYPEDQGMWYPGYPYLAPSGVPTTTPGPCYCSSSSEFEFTLSGVANKSSPVCEECADWNRHYVLTNSTGGGPNCTWVFVDPSVSICASSEVIVRLEILAGGLATLRFIMHIGGSFVGTATYEKLSFDCDGSNVLNLVTDAGHCRFWPSTITVTKVA